MPKELVTNVDQLVFPPNDVPGSGESVRVAAKRQQDLSMAQEVYKEKMTRIHEVTVTKKIKVVDMDLATKIKVVFILNSSDSESNYCLIHRSWS